MKTTIDMTKAKRNSVDNLVREAVKEKFGHVEPIVSELDKRFSSKTKDGKKVYGAYMRFLCENGHTVFVNLDEMEASVSEKPNAHAVGKVKRMATRKAERVKKAAEKNKADVKAAVKTAKARTAKVKATTTKGGSPAPESQKAAPVDPLKQATQVSA